MAGISFFSEMCYFGNLFLTNLTHVTIEKSSCSKLKLISTYLKNKYNMLRRTSSNRTEILAA